MTMTRRSCVALGAEGRLVVADVGGITVTSCDGSAWAGLTRSSR